MAQTPFTVEQMIENCAWLGTGHTVHQIAEYTFIEYKPTIFKDGTPVIPKQYAEESRYAVFVNGRPTNTSCGSMDMALVTAIAYKHEGAGSQAPIYFMKGIITKE